MSTHANIHIYDKEERFVSLYKHTDGYPSGLGLELYNFLVNIKLVNGLNPEMKNVANGMGCLAAQLIANFKTTPGDLYVISPNSDSLQDFNYHIYGLPGFILVTDCDDTTIYCGLIDDDFLKWVKSN